MLRKEKRGGVLPHRDRNHPHTGRRSKPLLAVLLGLSLHACASAANSPVGTPTGSSPSPTPTTQPTLPPDLVEPTEEPDPSPLAVLLAVPERWVPQAAAAVGHLKALDPRWDWQLDVGADPARKVAENTAHIALTSSETGIPSGSRPLAFAVPFTSTWDPLTREQAEALLQEPSPFVAILEWDELAPPLKALRVDGFHPGDQDYPVQQPWFLLATPGFEAAADALAPLLAETLGRDESIHLAFVGDIMLDRALGDQIQANQPSPFREVSERLTQADLTIGNLESALGSGGRPEDKGYTFLAPPAAAETLATAGFDLLSVANNHALDYGIEVFKQGRALLRDQGIRVVGAGEQEATAHAPAVFEVDGLTLAFLAYVNVPVEVRGFDTRAWAATTAKAGVAWAEPERIEQDVRSALDQADVVVVLLHSGYENVLDPSPPQTAAALAAVEAGAHLVVGHHAHVLQGTGFIGDSVIAYGLGNFAFEDGGPPESAILNVWVDSTGVRTLEFVPVMLAQDGHPAPASDAEADDILDQVYDLSKQLP
jgi:poly-gamma-glutamate capsule biosynthesis protein CapA/YwtB (metallophosphatase superfamily)